MCVCVRVLGSKQRGSKRVSELARRRARSALHLAASEEALGGCCAPRRRRRARALARRERGVRRAWRAEKTRTHPRPAERVLSAHHHRPVPVLELIQHDRGRSGAAQPRRFGARERGVGAPRATTPLAASDAAGSRLCRVGGFNYLVDRMRRFGARCVAFLCAWGARGPSVAPELARGSQNGGGQARQGCASA